MARGLLLVALAVVLVTVFSVIDCALTERYRVRALPRVLWLVIIVVVPVAGPFLWWTAGRAPYSSDSRRPRPTVRR
jgi:Phospholipase_D-nuclease N-terminal